MVTIIDIKKRKNADGEEFVSLVLQGKVETVISRKTGKPYLTAKKTGIPCTFNEVMARSLIGQTLQGEIEKIECKEYSFTIPGTDKVLKLNYTYEYNSNPVTIEEVVG